MRSHKGRKKAKNAKLSLFLKKPNSYDKSVLSLIIHYDNLISTAALKPGLSMEIHAKQKE